jgi:pilus assembly protein CpaC
MVVHGKLRAGPVNSAVGRYLPVVALALAAALAAQDRAPSAAAQEMRLDVGRSVVLDRPSDVARISISNPDVVDAVAVTTREILVNAKSAGLATLVIWSKTGVRTVFEVTVARDLESMRRMLKDTFPDESIDLRADRDSLALIGRASSQSVADRAMALVAPMVKTVVSNLQVVPPGADKQILLRVKFAELDLTAANSFGVNLLSTGALNTPGSISTQQFAGGTPSALNGTIGAPVTGTATNFSLSNALNIFAFRPDLNLGVLIQDLETKGVLQILSQPDLMTTNGKEASFLVGGEFPVPIPQAGAAAGAITIQFKEFGIRLNFTPQITTHKTIKMHVKPEVSSIDLSNAIVLSGFTIPALTTRRMETDVELGEGQTFVIAGLLDDRVTENLSQIPGLAHLPILGALFKSRSVTKSKTELLVLVTPESVSPLSATDPKPVLRMPREFLPGEPIQGALPAPAPSPAAKPTGAETTGADTQGKGNGR